MSGLIRATGSLFFKISENVVKKPRAIAKRALPRWKEGRKWILEKEGKNIKGEIQRAKTGPVKLPQRTKARHHQTISTFTKKVAKGRVGGKPFKGWEDSNLAMPVTHVAKPTMKVTDKQWKLLMERVAKRQPTGQASLDVAPEAKGMVDSVMGQAPMEGQAYGRLMEPVMSGGQQIGKQPREYPFPEAVEKYMGRGNKRIEPDMYKAPDADVLSMQGGKPSYERRSYSQVPKESIQRSEAAAVDVEADLTKRKVMTQAEKSAQKVDKMPSEKLVKKAMVLDAMWKFVKGTSITGRLWKKYSQSAKGRYKVKSPRDYFIRSGLRWMEDPEKFAKLNKREAKSLDVIWKEYNAETGLNM